MRPKIENLLARMGGMPLNNYQIALARREFIELLEYVTKLEQLTTPAVEEQSEQFYCVSSDALVHGKPCDKWCGSVHCKALCKPPDKDKKLNLSIVRLRALEWWNRIPYDNFNYDQTQIGLVQKYFSNRSVGKLKGHEIDMMFIAEHEA